MKSLCSHVCAKYMPFFKEVTYVSTFKGLLQRDEQEQDRKQQNNRILDRYGDRLLNPSADTVLLQ